MTTQSRARRTARAYQWLSGLDHFADFSVVVVAVLVLEARGMGAGEVLGVYAALWLVEAVFEVPTGVIADVVGRRRAVMISMVLRAIGYATLFFSASAGGAVTGVVIATIGGTFSSGALEAWAVDGMGENAGGELDRMFARARIAENVGLVAGTMTGSVIGLADVAAPYAPAAALSALGVVLAAQLMIEDRGTRLDDASGPRLPRRLTVAARGVLADTGRALFGDRALAALIATIAAMCAFRGIPGAQWTVHFDGVHGGGLIALGLVRSAIALLEIPALAVMSRLSGDGRGARRIVLVIAAPISGISLFVAAMVTSSLAGLITFAISSIAYGICMPGIRAEINERIESHQRATMLSAASVATGALACVGLLLASALVTDLDTISVSWPVAALGFTITGLVAASLVARPERAAPRSSLGVIEERAS
jgi:DHA3 family tetracycline resistance protein-like MFS transporter